MPHLDALLLRATFARDGQSRFARPVAAITEFVSRRLGKPGRASAAQDVEARAIETRFERAADIAEFARMEREFELRDAGGWNWR